MDLAERTVCVATLSLKPGTRLATAVRRADGALLLAAGTEIDIDQIRQLVQRNIDCVEVLQEETRDEAQIEREVAAAAARVAYLFRGQGSAARDELAGVIADYRRRAVA